MTTVCTATLRDMRAQKHRVECCLVLLTLMTAVLSVSKNSTAETSGTVTSKQPLYVLVTGPYPDPNETVWDGGISLIPAVRLAFQQINQNDFMLQNYTLQLIEEDSGCGSLLKPKVFQSFVKGRYYNQRNETKNTKIVGIIGPACSDPTLAIAPLLARPEVNLLQIAPTATSPLIETLNYNTTLTMMSSFLASTVLALTELMRCNHWLEVAILIDEEGTPAYFKTSSVIAGIEKRLRAVNGSNVSYVYRVYDSDEKRFFPLEEVRERRTRIIFVIAGPILQKIICLAYHLDMIYPQFQWIFSEQTMNVFVTNVTFKYNGEQITCSQDVMAKAANGSILINYSVMADSSTKITETGLNYSTYRELYMEYFRQHLQEPKVQAILKTVYQKTDKEEKDFLPSGIWENAYYDAGWALGLALDQLAKEGHNLYRLISEESGFTQLLIDKLLNVSFNGATGSVHFNRQTKSVNTTFLVTQVVVNNRTGELTERFLAKYKHTIRTCPPKSDFISHKFDESLAQIHPSLGVIVILTTCILTLTISLLQIAFISWRKRASIKAASPRITHLSFLGCYFFALATLVYTIQESFLTMLSVDTTYTVMCTAVLCCLMIGSSLILGTVFVTIWRLYKLFNHFKTISPGVLLTDTALICFVMLLVLTDIVICIVWTQVSPWTVIRTEIHNTGVKLKYHTLYFLPNCTCQGLQYWIIGVSVYKGSIALLLVILSILNRKIHRKHFSHTKQINALLYSMTVLAGIGFPLWFLLRDGFTIYPPYLIMCAILLSIMLLCTLLLFLPPVVPILKAKLDSRTDPQFIQKSHRSFRGRTFSTSPML